MKLMCMVPYLFETYIDDICVGADMETEVLDLQSAQTTKHQKQNRWSRA